MDHDVTPGAWRPPGTGGMRLLALASMPLLGLLLAAASVFASAGKASAQQTPATVTFCFQGTTLTLPTAQVLDANGRFLPQYAGATLGACAAASTPTTVPTAVPTTQPTTVPTTVPTAVPTTVPTTAPTTVPTQSAAPPTSTAAPSTATAVPSVQPSPSATSPASQTAEQSARIFAAPVTTTPEANSSGGPQQLILNNQQMLQPEKDADPQQLQSLGFDWHDSCDDDTPSQVQTTSIGLDCHEDCDNEPVLTASFDHDGCHDFDPCDRDFPMASFNDDRCHEEIDCSPPLAWWQVETCLGYDPCQPAVAHIFEYERAAQCQQDRMSCDHPVWHNGPQTWQQVSWNDWWGAHCKVNFCKDGHWDTDRVNWWDWQDHCKVDFCRHGDPGFHLASWERHDHCKIDFCSRGWDGWQMSWHNWSFTCKVDFCSDGHWDPHKMAWNDWHNRCEVSFCQVKHFDFDKKDHHHDRDHDGPFVSWDRDNHHDDDDWKKDWDHRFDKDRVHQICIQPQITVIINVLVLPPAPQPVAAPVPPAPIIVFPASPLQPVTTVAAQSTTSAATQVSSVTPPNTGDGGLAAEGEVPAAAPLAAAALALLFVAGGLEVRRRLR